MKIISKNTLYAGIIVASAVALLAVLGVCVNNSGVGSPRHSSAVDAVLDPAQGHFDSSMTFTGMPRTTAQAETDAETMAGTLKNFHNAGVKPLVVLEPQSYDDNTVLDLNSVAAGGSDALMTSYYQILKDHGITDDMMGEWVVLPEANTPAWNNTAPETVRSGIIHLSTAQKQVFPNSRVSIMLDSQTYQSNDQDWVNGQFVSLVPYVHDMPTGLIDSFGLQGFPSIAPGASPASLDVHSPTQFLPASMAIEAANALGVRNIWFNTGTFASMYGPEKGQVIIAAPQRQELLQSITQQLLAAKAAGYVVALNLFSANKSHTPEATDWSYSQSAADRQVLADFITTIRKNNIRLSFFDGRQP